MYRLQIIDGPDKGVSYQPTEAASLLVGRSRHVNCRLNDPSVSRVHCELEVKKGRVTITDLESRAGTFVNGQKIVEATLKEGDVVRIGDTKMVLETGLEGEASTLPLLDKPQHKLAAKTEPPSTETVPDPEDALSLTASHLHELTGKRLSYFNVGQMLSRGENGLVFKAVDLKSNQTVALKVYYPSFAEAETDMRRFVRGVKTMQPHNHPNLVRILGAGKVGKYCFYAMEFIDGDPLTQIIQRIGVAGMLDWRFAMRVAAHIAKALEYLHSNHIMHRDITPQNIIVQKAEKVAKLKYLLLAKAREGTAADQITRPGELIGDVRYMSPERVDGAMGYDERSDIYSLGATMYALLTGKPPCEGASQADTVKKIRSEIPVRPKKLQMALPDSVEGVVMRMLEKWPDARFQNAAELLKELERVARFQNATLW